MITFNNCNLACMIIRSTSVTNSQILHTFVQLWTLKRLQRRPNTSYDSQWYNTFVLWNKCYLFVIKITFLKILWIDVSVIHLFMKPSALQQIIFSWIIYKFYARTWGTKHSFYSIFSNLSALADKSHFALKISVLCKSVRIS